MNLFTSPFPFVLAAVIAVAGCASTSNVSKSSQSRESMLVASGFKTITPKTSAQTQKLQQLPSGKIAKVKKSGKTYYVYPDAPNNQAYVGGPKEYQAYLQLRASDNQAQENLETAVLYQDSMMNWGGWGGWGAGWGMMGVGRVGRF
jgi:hypothetical protein